MDKLDELFNEILSATKEGLVWWQYNKIKDEYFCNLPTTSLHMTNDKKFLVSDDSCRLCHLCLTDRQFLEVHDAFVKNNNEYFVPKLLSDIRRLRNPPF